MNELPISPLLPVMMRVFSIRCSGGLVLVTMQQSVEKPEEHNGHYGRHERAQEEAQRADAFVLEDLRVLQNADTRGVWRISNHRQTAARHRPGHESILEFVRNAFDQRTEVCQGRIVR